MMAPQTWGRASMGWRFRSAAVRLSACSRMPRAISAGLDFLRPKSMDGSGDLGLDAGRQLEVAESTEGVAPDPLLLDARLAPLLFPIDDRDGLLHDEPRFPASRDRLDGRAAAREHVIHDPDAVPFRYVSLDQLLHAVAFGLLADREHADHLSVLAVRRIGHRDRDRIGADQEPAHRSDRLEDALEHEIAHDLARLRIGETHAAVDVEAGERAGRQRKTGHRAPLECLGLDEDLDQLLAGCVHRLNSSMRRRCVNGRTGRRARGTGPMGPKSRRPRRPPGSAPPRTRAGASGSPPEAGCLRFRPGREPGAGRWRRGYA